MASSLASLSSLLQSVLAQVRPEEESALQDASRRLESVRRRLAAVLDVEMDDEMLVDAINQQVPRAQDLVAACPDLGETEQFVVTAIIYLVVCVTVHNTREIYDALLALREEDQFLFKSLFELLVDNDCEAVTISSFFGCIEEVKTSPNDSNVAISRSATPETPKSRVYSNSSKKKMERSASLKQFLDSPVARRMSRYQLRDDEHRKLVEEYREELDQKCNENQRLKLELDELQATAQRMQSTIDSQRKQLRSNDLHEAQKGALEQKVEELRKELKKQAKEKDKLLEDNKTRQLWEKCASLEEQLNREKERCAQLELSDKDKSEWLAKIELDLRKEKARSNNMTTMLEEATQNIEEYKVLVASLRSTDDSRDDSGMANVEPLLNLSISNETAADIVVADFRQQIEQKDGELNRLRALVESLERESEVNKEEQKNTQKENASLISKLKASKTDREAEKEHWDRLLEEKVEILRQQEEDINCLKSELNAFFEDKKRKQKEIEDLQLSMKALTHELLSEKEEAQNKIKLMGTDLANKESRIASLETEVSALQQKNRDDNDNANEKLKTLENLSNSKDAQITDLQETIMEINNASEKQELSFSNKIKALEQEKSMLLQNLENLQEECVKLKEEVQKARHTVEEVGSEKNRLIVAHQDQVNVLMNHLNTLDKETKEKQKSIEEEVKHERKLRETAEKKNSEMTALLDQVTGRHEELEEEITSLREEKSLMHLREESLLKQITSYEAESEEARQRLEKEQLAFEAFRQASQEQIDASKTVANKYKEEVANLRKDIDTLDRVKIELEVKARDLYTKLETKEEDFIALKTQLEDEQRKIEEELKVENEKWESEREKLNDELKSTNIKLTEIESDMSAIKSSKVELETKLSETIEECDTKGKAIDDLKLELEERNKENQERMKKMSENWEFERSELKKELRQSNTILKQMRQKLESEANFEELANQQREMTSSLQASVKELELGLAEMRSQLEAKTQLLVSVQSNLESAERQLEASRSECDSIKCKLNSAQIELQRRESLLVRAEENTKHYEDERIKLEEASRIKAEELKASLELKVSKIEEALKSEYNRKLEELNEKFTKKETISDAKIHSLRQELVAQKEEEERTLVAQEKIMQKYDASKKVIEKFQAENRELKAEKKKLQSRLAEAVQKAQRKEPPVIKVTEEIETDAIVSSGSITSDKTKNPIAPVEKSVAFEVPLDDFNFKQPDVHTPGRSRPGRTRSQLNLRRAPPVGAGALFATEEEEGQFLSFAPLSSQNNSDRLSLGGYSADGRISELARRNTLVPAHLKSTYPGETQFYHPNSFTDDSLRRGSIDPSNSNMTIIDNTLEGGGERKRAASAINAVDRRGSMVVDGRRSSMRLNKEDDDAFHSIQATGYSKPGPPTPAAVKRSRTTTTTLVSSTTTAMLNTSRLSNTSSVGAEAEFSGLSDMTNASSARGRLLRARVINSPKVLKNAVTRMLDNGRNKYSVLDEEKQAARAQKEQRNYL